MGGWVDDNERVTISHGGITANPLAALQLHTRNHMYSILYCLQSQLWKRRRNNSEIASKYHISISSSVLSTHPPIYSLSSKMGVDN